MRIASILLNVILIFIVIFLIIEDGWPGEIEVQLMVFIFFISPVLSIITLWGSHAANSDSWLSLFIQRKKLEEKAKLEKLKSATSEKNKRQMQHR